MKQKEDIHTDLFEPAPSKIHYRTDNNSVVGVLYKSRNSHDHRINNIVLFEFVLRLKVSLYFKKLFFSILILFERSIVYKIVF